MLIEILYALGSERRKRHGPFGILLVDYLRETTVQLLGLGLECGGRSENGGSRQECPATLVCRISGWCGSLLSVCETVMESPELAVVNTIEAVHASAVVYLMILDIYA